MHFLILERLWFAFFLETHNKCDCFRVAITHQAFIEPDLKTAHLKVVNNFNPFAGFQDPTYILKSDVEVTEDKIKEVLGEGGKMEPEVETVSATEFVYRPNRV